METSTIILTFIFAGFVSASIHIFTSTTDGDNDKYILSILSITIILAITLMFLDDTALLYGGGLGIFWRILFSIIYKDVASSRKYFSKIKDAIKNIDHNE